MPPDHSARAARILAADATGTPIPHITAALAARVIPNQPSPRVFDTVVTSPR